jgi:FtsP/CotA-like multicopper oxidase with cupredoxin domain
MKNLNKKTLAAALLCGAGLLAGGTTQAATVNLYAGTVSKPMPDGANVLMWAFGTNDPVTGVTTFTVPGPAIVVDPADTVLTINLVNTLPEPVSIVIPGQMPSLASMVTRQPLASDPNRAQSFSAAAAAGGGNATYTWNNLQPGTYLYHSGSHPAVQIQMGLYGAVTKDAVSPTVPYAGTTVVSQATLLYSEIDPAVHAEVAGGTYGTPGNMTSTIRSKAKYYLINGEAYDPAGPVPIAAGALVGQTVLLRFLNAGIDYRVPVLLNSDLRLIAEDGNLYTYAKDSYAVELAPMKTMDALWTVPAGTTAGTRFTLFDRRLGLRNNAEPGVGGMLTYLQAQ